MKFISKYIFLILLSLFALLTPPLYAKKQKFNFIVIPRCLDSAIYSAGACDNDAEKDNDSDTESFVAIDGNNSIDGSVVLTTYEKQGGFKTCFLPNHWALPAREPDSSGRLEWEIKKSGPIIICSWEEDVTEESQGTANLSVHRLVSTDCAAGEYSQESKIAIPDVYRFDPEKENCFIKFIVFSENRTVSGFINGKFKESHTMHRVMTCNDIDFLTFAYMSGLSREVLLASVEDKVNRSAIIYFLRIMDYIFSQHESERYKGLFLLTDPRIQWSDIYLNSYEGLKKWQSYIPVPECMTAGCSEKTDEDSEFAIIHMRLCPALGALTQLYAATPDLSLPAVYPLIIGLCAKHKQNYETLKWTTAGYRAFVSLLGEPHGVVLQSQLYKSLELLSGAGSEFIRVTPKCIAVSSSAPVLTTVVAVKEEPVDTFSRDKEQRIQKESLDVAVVTSTTDTEPVHTSTPSSTSHRLSLTDTVSNAPAVQISTITTSSSIPSVTTVTTSGAGQSTSEVSVAHDKRSELVDVTDLDIRYPPGYQKDDDVLGEELKPCITLMEFGHDTVDLKRVCQWCSQIIPVGRSMEEHYQEHDVHTKRDVFEVELTALNFEQELGQNLKQSLGFATRKITNPDHRWKVNTCDCKAQFLSREALQWHKDERHSLKYLKTTRSETATSSTSSASSFAGVTTTPSTSSSSTVVTTTPFTSAGKEGLKHKKHHHSSSGPLPTKPEKEVAALLTTSSSTRVEFSGVPVNLEWVCAYCTMIFDDMAGYASHCSKRHDHLAYDWHNKHRLNAANYRRVLSASVNHKGDHQWAVWRCKTPGCNNKYLSQLCLDRHIEIRHSRLHGSASKHTSAIVPTDPLQLAIEALMGEDCYICPRCSAVLVSTAMCKQHIWTFHHNWYQKLRKSSVLRSSENVSSEDFMSGSRLTALLKASVEAKCGRRELSAEDVVKKQQLTSCSHHRRFAIKPLAAVYCATCSKHNPAFKKQLEAEKKRERDKEKRYEEKSSSHVMAVGSIKQSRERDETRLHHHSKHQVLNSSSDDTGRQSQLMNVTSSPSGLHVERSSHAAVHSPKNTKSEDHIPPQPTKAPKAAATAHEQTIWEKGDWLTDFSKARLPERECSCLSPTTESCPFKIEADDDLTDAFDPDLTHHLPKNLERKYAIFDRCGEGAEGNTYFVHPISSIPTEADKVLVLKCESHAHFRRHQWRDRHVNLMQEGIFNHENFVNVLAHGVSGKNYFQVMESLPIVLDNYFDPPFSHLEVWWVMRGVVSAIAHVHGSGVAWRDLKRSNIGIGADGKVKLFDFGTAKRVARTQGLTCSVAYTGAYARGYLVTAKEEGQEYSEKSMFNAFELDCFLMGVLLCEMHTGTILFGQNEDFEEDDEQARFNRARAEIKILRDGNLIDESTLKAILISVYQNKNILQKPEHKKYLDDEIAFLCRLLLPGLNQTGMTAEKIYDLIDDPYLLNPPPKQVVKD
ncbi:protein kinase domain-containing protein [Spongorhabdus nitratireducens]